jgi:hypothetical protein
MRDRQIERAAQLEILPLILLMNCLSRERLRATYAWLGCLLSFERRTFRASSL